MNKDEIRLSNRKEIGTISMKNVDKEWCQQNLCLWIEIFLILVLIKSIIINLFNVDIKFTFKII